ncbi:MAG: DUF1361 domain-containing protein [Cytophagales bacterium]|nr:DUF1361 domain-containing protein [Cytophagales bacterium]
MKVKNHLVHSGLLSGFAVIMLLVRIGITESLQYSFLLWNLALAWVPLMVTKNLGNVNRDFSFGFWCLVGIWLLFLPNSPYLITDLKHLKRSELDYSWVDPLIFFSFSFVGLYIAMVSTSQVHKALALKFNVGFTWFFILICFVLSGFGVYLGRIERYNSWDLFTHPFRLFRGSWVAIQNEQALWMTFSFGFFMFLVYILFFRTSDLHLKHEI